MNTLKQLRIGKRLGLAFGLLLLLMVLVAGVGVAGIFRVASGLETVYRDRTVPLSQLGELNALSLRNRMLVAEMLRTPSFETIKKLNDELKANLQRGQTLLDAYLGSRLTADEDALAKRFVTARKAYVDEGLLPIAEALAGGGMSSALQTYETKTLPLGTQAAELSAQLVKLQIDVAASEYDKGRATRSGALAASIALTVVALVLGAGMAWLITRSIAEPVRRAVDLAQAVAAGDLSTHIDAEGRDEIAELLNALGQMNTGLVGLVRQVREGADQILTGAGEIANGNADLSQRTEQQASSLQQTAASMEELNATVRQNADTAQTATQLAASASSVAARGGEVVEQVVATMNDISNNSRKIADIIGVIDGIAFQTNILALNAAVEAARAGEQGRGFAVVASEVRSLATRSAEAAREIKSLISHSVGDVETGSRLVGEAGSTMTEIVTQVRRVADLIGEIGSATQEQTTGIGQVSEAVSQLDKVTQQNAALVEEAAAAADSLRQQAQRMHGVVEVFKL